MKLSTKKHRMPGAPTCRKCGKPLTGASGIGCDTLPNGGDYSVCMYCGNVMVYAADLSLRELTQDELYQIYGDSEVARAIQAARRAVKAADSAPDTKGPGRGDAVGTGTR